jgi:hypothetical protein
MRERVLVLNSVLNRGKNGSKWGILGLLEGCRNRKNVVFLQRLTAESAIYPIELRGQVDFFPCPIMAYDLETRALASIRASNRTTGSTPEMACCMPAALTHPTTNPLQPISHAVQVYLYSEGLSMAAFRKKKPADRGRMPRRTHRGLGIVGGPRRPVTPQSRSGRLP